MKKIFFTFIFIISSLSTYPQICPVISSAWDTRTNTNSSLSPKCLATDDYGNIYIAGNIAGISDFNNGVPSISASSGGSLFIVKYDKAGNTLWAINAGSNTVTNDIGGIKVSPDGTQIFVAGVISTVSTFGAITLTPKIRTGSIYSNDIFVAKLVDNGGSRTWAWAVNAGGKGDDRAHDLAIDNFGKIYFGGFITSYDTDGKGNEEATFGSLPIIDCIYNKDSYVSRLTDNGTSATFDWVKTSSVSLACNLADNRNEDMMIGLTCNKTTGDVFIGGFYYTSGSALSYEPFSLGSTTFPYGYGYEGYVAKLNSSGNWQWATKIGGPTNAFFGSEYVRALSVDSVGSVYITGDFSQTVGFGLNSNDIPNLTATSSGDAFIAKINPSGTFLWAKQMGGTGADFGSNIAYHNGQVWGIGTFRNSANFKTANQLTSVGTSDIYLAHLDKNGNWLNDGATRAGGPSDDGFYPTSIATNKIGFAVDNTNVPVATGRYQTNATIKSDFGSTILQKQDDSFVFRANCNETPPICTQSLSAYMPAYVSSTENTNGNFSILSMLKDGSNNTFLAGRISASVTFEMAAGGTQTYLMANGAGIVVALNPNNKAIWVVQMGSANTYIRDIDFSSGGIAFVGYMTGTGPFTTFDFATGTATNTQNQSSTNGTSDIIYGEIATRGGITALNFVYLVLGDASEIGLAISFNNATNHFAITGHVPQNATQTNFRSIMMPPTPGTTLFVAIYEKTTITFFGNSYIQATCKSLGYPTQTPGYTTVAESYGIDVLLDASNTAYVTGIYSYNNFAQPSFGPSFGSTTLLPSNGTNGLVAKFSNGGGWLWATKAGNEANSGMPLNDTRLVNIVFGETGNLYITGYSKSAVPIKFGNTPTSEIPALVATQDYDAIVAKINTSGTWQWANRNTGVGTQLGGGITFKNNRVQMVGVFEGIANFGGLNLASVGNFDFYFAELSPLGQWLTEKTVRGGGVNLDGYNGELTMPMATDQNNVVYSAGYFQGSTTFGGSNLINSVAPTYYSALVVKNECVSCNVNPIVLSNPAQNIPSFNPTQKTASSITATNHVLSGTVLYQAGTSIQLNPGFKVDAGVVFKAQMGGCQ